MREWFAKNRYLIVLLILIVIGAAIDIAAHLQPSYLATVLSVSDPTYTPARRSGRSRRSARYGATLAVRFSDENGVEQTATFRFTTTHKDNIPEEGGSIPVVKGLRGVTAYPDSVLRTIGTSLYGPPGVLFLLSLLTKLLQWRKQRREADG